MRSGETLMTRPLALLGFLALVVAPQGPSDQDGQPPQSAPTTRTAASAPNDRPRLPSLPTARHGHRAHRIGGTTVVFGGFCADAVDADRGQKETWIHDAGARTWRRGADMGAGRAFFGSAAVNGRIWAVGDGIESYDVERDRWTTVAPAGSMPHSHFAVAALGRQIYALGGFPAKAGGFVGFDLDTGGVIDPPEPPGFGVGDHLHVMATLGNEIHAIGGLDDDAGFVPTADHWIFDGSKWRAGVRPPVALWAKFAAVQTVGDALFVFAGAGALRYEGRTATWHDIAKMPRLLAMPATIEVDGFIHVLGGLVVAESLPAEPGGRVMTYDIRTGAWLPAP